MKEHLRKVVLLLDSTLIEPLSLLSAFLGFLPVLFIEDFYELLLLLDPTEQNILLIIEECAVYIRGLRLYSPIKESLHLRSVLAWEHWFLSGSIGIGSDVSYIWENVLSLFQIGFVFVIVIILLLRQSL